MRYTFGDEVTDEELSDEGKVPVKKAKKRLQKKGEFRMFDFITLCQKNVLNLFYHLWGHLILTYGPQKIKFSPAQVRKSV